VLLVGIVIQGIIVVEMLLVKGQLMRKLGKNVLRVLIVEVVQLSKHRVIMESTVHKLQHRALREIV